jgi:tetratricopeptide (TPR) repeat protein
MARRTREEKTRSERPPPSLRSRLLAALLSTLFTLVCLEGALWVWASLQDPQSRIPEGSELEAPDPDAFRVLAVGDSWVFGAESEPAEAFIEVFADLVEAETGRRAQVYNFGHSATNSSQAFIDVAENLEYVQPHLVVALSGANNMLHDKGVAEAARIMGEDIRLSPWWRLFGWSRTYRLVRQLWVVHRSSEQQDEAVTPDPVPDLLYGSGGADPGGRTGLPVPPVAPPAAAPPLEWSEHYFRRDFVNGLLWVQATDPVDPDDPGQRGTLKAWEALFLAHIGSFDEAEAAARESLELGGDRATAWEALAVSAALQDRPLEAIKHRIRVAETDSLADGYLWFAARARGLVLLELEAWEAAEAWLMAAQRVQPGNLEVLLGLSRLPEATRGEAVGLALADGPRGKVTQLEYYRWHEVSSGMIDRMVASLGEVDADEPAALWEGRGRAALVTDDRPAATRWLQGVIDRPDAGPLDRARARAGLIDMAEDPQTFEELLGVPPAGVELDPSTAAALVGFHAGRGDCDEAVRVGQLGLALGMAPQDFERSAGSCLSREVGWSLVETALGRGPVLDRAALVLGRPAGSIAGPVAAPDLAFWSDFRERRFERVVEVTDGAWEGLALVHAGRQVEAVVALDAAAAAGDDPAVIAWGRALLAADAGDLTGSVVQGMLAADAEGGEPWVREVARGFVLARGLRWRGCQAPLLSALRVAPGYLEALEILAEVPQPLRYPAAEVALRYVPSGSVPADRWSDWYRAQERWYEARLALEWRPGFLPEDASSPARRALALGRIEEGEGNVEAARAAYAEAMHLAEGLESQHLYCRAAARRVVAAAAEVDDEELYLMTGACEGQADALDAAGRIAALRGECDRVQQFAQASVVAGADPADVSEWMEPCAPAEQVDRWTRQNEHAPERAIELLLHRIHPGTEDELPAPGEQPASSDLLVRQLAAMDQLVAHQGGDLVALTYPFPGAHHQRLRDRLVVEAAREGLPLLDLYDHFSTTYSDQDWQDMRTPQDHVNASGYAEMGQELFREVKRRGRLPQ